MNTFSINHIIFVSDPARNKKILRDHIDHLNQTEKHMEFRVRMQCDILQDMFAHDLDFRASIFPFWIQVVVEDVATVSMCRPWIHRLLQGTENSRSSFLLPEPIPITTLRTLACSLYTGMINNNSGVMT